MMPREPWRTRLLLLSAAGNLFALALIGTHVALRHPPGPPRPQAVIDHMARDLQGDDASRFRAAMGRTLPEMENARARMEAARAEMSRAIGRDPYDEAALRVAIKAWQAAWIAWSDQLGGGLVTAVADLSPDGRHRLAEAGLRHRHP